MAEVESGMLDDAQLRRSLWRSAARQECEIIDDNFNKKPNSAKSRPEKNNFVVLLFLGHKRTSKSQEYH